MTYEKNGFKMVTLYRGKKHLKLSYLFEFFFYIKRFSPATFWGPESGHAENVGMSERTSYYTRINVQNACRY